jgi:hypothetical protein
MEAVPIQPANRRESLYYLWTASILLIIGLLVALLFWFMRQPLTIPSKIVPIELAKIPPSGSITRFPTYGFFLAHTDGDALIAVEGVEPRFGCFVKWIVTNHRFEEPCHGYKFELDGTYIEGMPAPHDLNRYFMTITFADGQIISSNEAGDPIPLEGRAITAISVDVCRLIEGKHDPKFVSSRIGIAIYGQNCTPD